MWRSESVGCTRSRYLDSYESSGSPIVKLDSSMECDATTKDHATIIGTKEAAETLSAWWYLVQVHRGWTMVTHPALDVVLAKAGMSSLLLLACGTRRLPAMEILHSMVLLSRMVDSKHMSRLQLLGLGGCILPASEALPCCLIHMFSSLAERRVSCTYIY